jgi:hypothetical protein
VAYVKVQPEGVDGRPQTRRVQAGEPLVWRGHMYQLQEGR